MKVYEEIQHALYENLTTILYSEWDMNADDEAENLIQRVEYRNPSEAVLPMEKAMFEEGKPIVEKQGDHRVMAEPFYPEDRLIVLGGGHVALPLVEFASKCGFSVTVVDDRLMFANPERFPWASHVICDSFMHAICDLKIRKQDYVCVLTRGHRFDSECLRAILSGEEPGYLGMIGSRRRVAIVKEQLMEEGYSEEALGRLHSPIGLKIGGITPAEIAVSILAELISAKRLGQGSMTLRTQSDLDYSVVERLAAEKDVPKAVITVTSAKGSVPRGAGAKMLVYPDGRLLGSIGGGCSEAAVLVIARRMIGTGTFRVEHIDLTGDAAEDEGMVCGGIMDVLIQDVPVEV